ncbi:hypothetical protein BJV82DRAFT_710533 [Fennellomyces sp. T-0311]|nr:hypothetical protein BJV82DRAFT_710533 [Fennellomyces sp. T-0311]
MSVFTRNDSTLYMYGGFLKSHSQNNRSLPGGMPATNVFDAISIDPHDGMVRHIVLPPGDTKVGLSQAVVFPDHVLFIGGYCQDCFNASELFLSQYFFDQQRWDSPPTYGSGPPQGTVSATLADDGKVYIRYQQGHPNDFWSYDPFSGQFENLSVTLSPRDLYPVHFSWKLPDGNVAFLAENDADHNYSLDVLLVYNTRTRAWSSRRIGAKNQQHKNIPQNKRYFGITNDQSSKKIYLYGGVAVNPPYGGYSDLKVLDTSTWTWESPHYAGAPPRSQYRHGMEFINENTLVLIGGIISSLWELRVDKTMPFLAKGDYWCDHINVLQISNTTAEWVTNITHHHTIDESISSSPSAYFIDPRAITYTQDDYQDFSDVDMES